MTEHMDRIGVLLVNSPDVPTDMSDVADGAAIVATVQRALNTLHDVRCHNVNLLARAAEYDTAHDRMIKVLNGCPIPFDSLGTPDEVAAAVEKALQAWYETELALSKRANQCDELHRENARLEAENLRLTRELAQAQQDVAGYKELADSFHKRYESETIRSETYREALELVIETVKS